MKDEKKNQDRKSTYRSEPQGTEHSTDTRPIREKVLAVIDRIKDGEIFDAAITANNLSSSDFFETVESDPEVESAFLKAKDFARKLLVERALAIFQKSVQPLDADTEVTAEMLRAATACLTHDGPLANDPNSEPAVPPALAELARALAQRKGNLTDDYDR
jgi:hypothetical protein